MSSSHFSRLVQKLLSFDLYSTKSSNLSNNQRAKLALKTFLLYIFYLFNVIFVAIDSQSSNHYLISETFENRWIRPEFRIQFEKIATFDEVSSNIRKRNEINRVDLDVYRRHFGSKCLFESNEFNIDFMDFRTFSFDRCSSITTSSCWTSAVSNEWNRSMLSGVFVRNETNEFLCVTSWTFFRWFFHFVFISRFQCEAFDNFSQWKRKRNEWNDGNLRKLRWKRFHRWFFVLRSSLETFSRWNQRIKTFDLVGSTDTCVVYQSDAL